jgi:hypothetical protein
VYPWKVHLPKEVASWKGREVHEAKNGVGAKTIAARERGRGLQSVNFGSETSAERGWGAVVAGVAGRMGEKIRTVSYVIVACSRGADAHRVVPST